MPALLLASIRPGAAFLAVPVFSIPQVPVLLRFVLALAVGVSSSGATHMSLPLPPEGLTSVAGLLLIVGEVLIGLTFGFALQAGIAAAMVAGEVIGNAMGLGFAATVDPMSGHGTPALSQLLAIIATLVFLGMDGHLVFIAILGDSYRTLPVGTGIPSPQSVAAVVAVGGLMFTAAAALALPMVTGIILVQLVMALLARAAPAINLLSVGLPAALLAGLLLFASGLPVLGAGIANIVNESLSVAARLPIR